MGDNGNEFLPQAKLHRILLTETYDSEADRKLLLQAIREGWLAKAEPKYQAAMDYLHDIVAGRAEATPSLRVKAVRLLLKVSQHTADVLAPSAATQEQEQRQGVIVNVGSPDGPLAKLRAQWAEKTNAG